MNRRQFVSSGLAMTGAALSGNNRGICAQTRGDDHAEHFSREALSSVRPSEEAAPETHRCAIAQPSPSTGDYDVGLFMAGAAMAGRGL